MVDLFDSLNSIDTFKGYEYNDEDFCITSTSIVLDWDSQFGTNLYAQDNFIIFTISPNGKCNDGDVLSVAIVDFENKSEVECECKKMYDHFENGGLRGPFSGHMTCYEQHGVLVMIEFLWGNINPEILNLFEKVSLYN